MVVKHSRATELPRDPMLWLKTIVVAAGTTLLVLYLLVALSRMCYPFELEWMEGDMVMHTMRVVEGKQLYMRPSLDWVPFIYPPLYYYCAAGLTSVVGGGFLPLRLLSFAASLGCFVCIYKLVRLDTASSFAAFVATTLFAATFSASGAWFDIARVDSLFLFFLLAGFLLLRSGGTKALLLAGLVFALSFLTKQTALSVFLPVLVWALVNDFRRGLVVVASFATAAGVSCLYINWQSDGWFWFYTFEVPSRHAWLDGTWQFWSNDIWGALPVLSVVVAAWLLFSLLRSRSRVVFFYLALLVGALGTSWVSRLHRGGALNVLFPAYAAMAIGFGLAVARIGRSTESSSLWKRGALPVVLLACIVQLWYLSYHVDQHIPTRNDRQAGERLLRTLRSIPGQILIPSHGYLAVVVGKEPSASGMAWGDVFGASPKKLRSALLQEWVRAFEKQKYSAVILDHAVPTGLPALGSMSEKAELIFEDPDVFFTVTGARARPQFLYRSK